MKTIRRIIFACITIWVLAVTVAPKYDKQINAIFEKVLGPYHHEDKDADTEKLSTWNDTENTEAKDITPAPENSLEVTFIDVGQGDSILIEDAGKTMLIDTGYWDAYDTLKQTFSDKGIERIDALVLTHPDADHIGAAEDIITHYQVGIIYTSVANSDSKTYQYVQDAIELYNVPVNYPQAGDTMQLGNAVYEWLGPVNDVDDTNSMSLVLKVVNGNDSFLFTGDMTGKEMKDITGDMSADVLKAAHHGSANEGCNSSELFDRVKPEYAVISCGKGNRYGHPHKETMQEIKQRGIKCFRTDEQGTISCTSTGNGIVWSVEPTTDYHNGSSEK